MFAIKSDKTDPEAEPRTYIDPKTKQEVTVYEKRVPYIDGYIVGLEVDTTGEYGSQLKITLRDAGVPDYTVPIPLNKSYGVKVAETIPNIKIAEKVTLTAYGDFSIDGKEVKAGISVRQGEEKIGSYFNVKEGDKWVTKDNYPANPSGEAPDKLKNPAKYTKFWADYFYSVEEYLVDYFQKT